MYLKAHIGEHYKYSNEPVFKKLWENYNFCQFVEDEGAYEGYLMESRFYYQLSPSQAMSYSSRTSKVRRFANLPNNIVLQYIKPLPRYEVS